MRPALAAAACLLLAGCSDRVDLEVPELSEVERAACADLVAALPDTLLGEVRRPVTPEDAPGAAWGDPAVTVTCGVGDPEGYEPGMSCVAVGGVGWFVPPEQQEDLTGEVVATVLTHTPRVALTIPGEHRDAGVDGALAELAGPIREALQADEPCL